MPHAIRYQVIGSCIQAAAEAVVDVRKENRQLWRLLGKMVRIANNAHMPELAACAQQYERLVKRRKHG